MLSQNSHSASTRPHARDVVQVFHGQETSDGAGVRLTRLIATHELPQLDPFLLLDAFRSDDPDDYIAGFPPHPHRGFETVTYLLAGRFRHRDSAGHEGVIEAGGVQWMTAGLGIEHSEMPEQEQGLLYGFQLWVNLPAAKKMAAPRYQEFGREAIPVETREGGQQLRVIAGKTSRGTAGPVTDIAAQPLYLDVSLPAGSAFEEAIAPGHNAFIYLIEGELSVHGDGGSRVLGREQLAILGDGGQLKADTQTDSRFLLIAGQPFGEPIARHGPFVMNSEAEILQAYADYRDGRFGHISEA